MIDVEVKRSMRVADIAEIVELAAATERADGHHPLSDHHWLDLVDGGRPGFAGLVGRQQGHEHPVGYAQLSRTNDSWGLELVVHPHHRYDVAEIGPVLLGAALEVVASEGGGHVHWWVFEPSAAHEKIAAGLGLTPGRRLLQLRCVLPLHPALGVAAPTRPFNPTTDVEDWLRVNNLAFAHHPEQGGWTEEVLASRMKEDWFLPDGFRVAEVDGQMAGFCWTKEHEGDPPLGEIYVIAVDPAFHGRGLGRGLTIAGLDHLAGRGLRTGMLFVDADNAAAVGLYTSLGFSAYRTDRAFVGDVGAKWTRVSE